MTSALAQQLSLIAAKSFDSLNLKAQKANHSKSLLHEPRVAAAQSFDTIYNACHDGFVELCQLDARFASFENDLFSLQSQETDRTQLTKAQNAELDTRIELFLGLVGARLRLAPAVQALEWLIRRYRVHELNTSFVLTTFLPYHTLPIFATLLSILPKTLPDSYLFLHPYIRSLNQPPRAVIIHASATNAAFLAYFNNYIVQVCKARHHHSALLTFWAGIMSEATNAMLTKAMSGRHNVQIQNEQEVILKLLPTLNEGLSMKKVPELRIGCYLLLVVMASKVRLGDKFNLPMMEAVASGWSQDTLLPGLTCVSVLAQHCGAHQLSSRLAKSLLRVDDIVDRLIAISQDRKVDRLATGLCLALVRRLTKKSDSSGLNIIPRFFEADLLREEQIKLVTKAMLLAAHQVEEKTDPDGSLRSMLGSFLANLAHSGDHLSIVVDATLKEIDIDMDDLELRLHTTIRPKAIEAADDEDTNMEDAATGSTIDQFQLAMQHLLSHTTRENSFLTEIDSALYRDLYRAFEAAGANPNNLESFDAQPIVCREEALKRSSYLTFYMRYWTGRSPVLSRVNALSMLNRWLDSQSDHDLDLQALLPYLFTALADPAIKLRRAAAAALVKINTLHPKTQAKGTSKKSSGPLLQDMYGNEQKCPHPIQWVGHEVTARMLHDVLLPSLEECVLHQGHIYHVLATALTSTHGSVEKSKTSHSARLSQANRLSIFAYLASHCTRTPSLKVKLVLLRALNRVSSIGSATRTKFLLPVLQDWVSLPSVACQSMCREADEGELVTNHEMLRVIVATDKEGVDFLKQLLKGSTASDRKSLLEAVTHAVKILWPSMRNDTRSSLVIELFQMTQSPVATDCDTDNATQAAELLQTLSLSTEDFVNLLAQLPTPSGLGEEARSPKRRRTNHSQSVQVSNSAHSDIHKITREWTFVLQLIDGSRLSEHPQLLPHLFEALSELQYLKVHVASDIAYLQILLLHSLLGICQGMDEQSIQKVDMSSIKIDSIVDCVQKTSNAQLQNAGLLLVASLTKLVPEHVLHGIMPIFTFLGSSVLLHNDEYSSRVVDRTIRDVIPTLVASIQIDSKTSPEGIAKLLLSFVAAYEHMPQHRREELFTTLVLTIGPRDSLYAVLAMLVDKYGMGDDLAGFAVHLMDSFDVEMQLETMSNIMDLAIDVMQQKPSLASKVLNVQAGSTDTQGRAAKQLQLASTLASARNIRSRVSKPTFGQGMEAVTFREIYSNMFRRLLTFSKQAKQSAVVHNACGNLMGSLLTLLPISEFVNNIERLIDQSDAQIGLRVLRSLQMRITDEKVADDTSRRALLDFLPQLNSIIRNSSDAAYQQAAIACVDQIAEKYGKKDLEAVAAAVDTIVTRKCISHGALDLQIQTLLCLASVIDILQDAMVPMLPAAISQSLQVLTSLVTDTNDSSPEHEKLKDAAFAFLAAVSQNVPFAFTSAMLGKLFHVASKFARSTKPPVKTDMRMPCLTMAARCIDIKVVLAALDRSWSDWSSQGQAVSSSKAVPTDTAMRQATTDWVTILAALIESRPRPMVAKHADAFTTLLRHGFSMYDDTAKKGTDPSVFEVEAYFHRTVLKLVYKFNDALFRPIFSDLVEWASTDSVAPSQRVARLTNLYGFMGMFFGDLKSIVTSYAALFIDNAVELLKSKAVESAGHDRLRSCVLETLKKAFEHDQDDFWQSPSHFDVVAPALCSRLDLDTTINAQQDLLPTIVELAAAADSAEHQKTLNSMILKRLRSASPRIRLAAVKCEQALTERLGEDWLSMLPEMLPYISELQEDDDESVERETHVWIVKIEGVLGESLDAMLQ